MDSRDVLIIGGAAFLFWRWYEKHKGQRAPVPVQQPNEGTVTAPVNTVTPDVVVMPAPSIPAPLSILQQTNPPPIVANPNPAAQVTVVAQPFTRSTPTPIRGPVVVTSPAPFRPINYMVTDLPPSPQSTVYANNTLSVPLQSPQGIVDAGPIAEPMIPINNRLNVM